MIRITDATLLAIAIGGAIYTYQLKHEAELSAKRIDSLRAQIAAQDRKIALLEADWALETNPKRLERIAVQFSDQLKLMPLTSSQIVDTSELPAFKVDRDEEDDAVYADKDRGTLTGGISDLIKQKGADE